MDILNSAGIIVFFIAFILVLLMLVQLLRAKAEYWFEKAREIRLQTNKFYGTEDIPDVY